MILIRNIFLTVLLLTAHTVFPRYNSGIRKPRATLNGIRKGNMDKLAFFSIKEIEMTGGDKNDFEIISYEFNFSCKGEIILKAFQGAAISKEIIQLVKSCSASCIADFTSIKAKNKKTGKFILLNDILLTVTS